MATLNFWRSSVCLSSGQNVPPVAPLGGIVVAYIQRNDAQDIRHPMRTFWLSCLRDDGGIDGVDYPGDGATNLVVPSSVTPKVAYCQPATDFRRIPRRGVIELRVGRLLAERRKLIEQYAVKHGFSLPESPEQLEPALPF